jgi:hypothetical protein
MPNEREVMGSEASLNAPGERSTREAQVPQAGKDDPEKYGVQHCCVREFWAIIERDGTLVRGRNVLRTCRLAQGQYEVFFTGDVREGVYVATIGRPGIYTEPPGEIGVALRYPGNPLWMPFEDNNGVWVDTHDSSGNYSDRAFHLVVLT